MSSYEPDPDTARLFTRHKQAAKTLKDTKKPVTEAVERAIRQGATSPELAEMTGLSGQTIRNIAEKIGVDIRLKPPTVGREVEAKRARSSPAAGPYAELVDSLTDEQAAQLAIRVYTAADRRQYAELNEASTRGDRAVLAAALANGTIDESALRLP